MITTNTLSTTENTPPSPALQNDTNIAASASDFQSFLSLLTAQLRNQDPLSPLDSTQFVEQLASFSAVEQQIETNNRLETLIGNLTSSGLEGAVQWVGKGVEAESNAASFQGEPLTYRLPQSSTGGTPEIEISDRNGDVVFQRTIDAGESDFTWAGETADGAVADNGNYVVTINFMTDGEIVEARQPIAVTKVTEARFIDGAVNLVLGNGDVVRPENVLAVRDIEQSEPI